MSWRDNLREASFRGVPFWFAESEHSGGRRLQVHEYPNRDVPYTEDLGRKAREWSIEAFVFGDEYMAARDALIDALNAKGAGELVHPREGRHQVCAGDFTVSESTSSGGYAQFSISFVEAGERDLPGKKENTVADVNDKADKALDLLGEELDDKLSLESGLSLESITKTLEQGISELNGINGKIDAATYPVSEWGLRIDELSNSAAHLIKSPADFVHTLAGVSLSVYGAFNAVASALSAYSGLDEAFGFTPVVPDTTDTNKSINANQIEAAKAFKVVNVVSAVKAITNMSQAVDASPSESNFESFTEVIQVRDAILSTLDSVSNDSDYALFESLQALKVSFNKHLNNHGMRLPRVHSHTLKARRPLLVMAYELLSDPLEVEDLRIRNNLDQPLFVEQGAELEYLS